MFPLVLADAARIWNLDLWYALPAIISVSLVYAASRHEPMRPILAHAVRVSFWLIGFLAVGAAVLAVFSWYMNA
jgi:hypothetical protein